MSVDWRELRATSKPAPIAFEAPWKHVTSLPPKPKLTTGTRTDVRPSGSLEPSNDGEGAYGACTSRAATDNVCAPDRS